MATVRDDAIHVAGEEDKVVWRPPCEMMGLISKLYKECDQYRRDMAFSELSAWFPISY